MKPAHIKSTVKMGNPHMTHLEDSKWTDKVFTGDSDKNTAALNFFARQRELAT
jgi:hypothetical protein